MSLIKQAPNQPYVETQGRFDWENEETLVDRRRKLPYRIRRVVSQWWIWAILVGIFVLALFDADVMRVFMTIAGVAAQIGLLILVFLSQFLLMFWFLGKARMYTIMPGAEGIGFADYRGQPEILEQAQQIVTLLRGVSAFEGSGGEPLNGLLLEGPPGTGKTWLAQAISTEAGVPFFFVDTSSLQAMFMGMGAMKVGRMYAKARKAAKEYGAAVVFLDEIDSIGSRSGVSAIGGGTQGGGGGGAGMGLLSTMLIEMSGFSLEHGWRARLRASFYKTFLRRNPPPPQKRVLTIGATNRMQALDPALLRPGRFDKKLRIDAPDTEGRREIFTYYLSKMAHDDSMEPTVLATETPHYTPADIRYVLNETLRYALFSGRRYMTYRDFQLAKPEHKSGLRAPIKHITKEARQRLAFYQAGRAVAVRLFLPEHRIARVTIVRQGLAFGHVSHFPARDAYQGMQTRDQYLNRLRAYAAGRAAEVEFFGVENQSMSVLANMGNRDGDSDFTMIRRMLQMMARAGMLGPLGGSLRVGVSMSGVSMSVSPEMAEAMEETFQRIMKDSRKALRLNEHIVRALAAKLIEKEELYADEVREFFDQYGLFTPDPTMIKAGEEVSVMKPRLTGGEATAQAGD